MSEATYGAMLNEESATLPPAVEDHSCVGSHDQHEATRKGETKSALRKTEHRCPHCDN